MTFLLDSCARLVRFCSAPWPNIPPPLTSGLTAGQDYEIQVRALNPQGEGGWSFSAVGSPRATGRVATLDLPLVALLRTPVQMALTYVSPPLPPTP